MNTPKLYQLKQYAHQRGFVLREDGHSEVKYVLQERDGTPLILFSDRCKPISWAYSVVYKDFYNRMTY